MERRVKRRETAELARLAKEWVCCAVRLEQRSVGSGFACSASSAFLFSALC